MTTDAARKAVFNTSELLEAILVCLPPQTLFGVQRVSKKFQAIIATSIPIQEKMFLRLRSKPQPKWSLRRELGRQPYFVETGEHPRHNQCTPTYMNPFLKLAYGFWRGETSNTLSCAEKFDMHFCESARLVFEKPVTITMLEGKAPSVLDTYLSDPPCDNLEVSCTYQLVGHSIRISRYMVRGERGNGTLRDLICQTMVDDGVAYVDQGRFDSDLEPLGFREDECGGVDKPRQVIEHYEGRSQSTAASGSVYRGFSEVRLRFHDWVLPTEAERAVVKLRGAGP